MLLSGLLIPAQAVEALKSDTLPQAQARLERLEQQVTSAQTATAQELKTLKKEVATVRATAQDCVERAKPGIENTGQRTRHIPARKSHRHAGENGRRDPARRTSASAIFSRHRPAAAGSAEQER